MRQRKDGIETRRRILDSAVVEFGRKGFRDATIEDICKRAETNIASVNYHFGDKETLYVEAWRQAFQHSLEKHSPDGGVPFDASVEERFHGRVLALMKRIADSESYEFEIVNKELANPSGLLAEVLKKSIEPLRHGFTAIIRELLGEKATDQEVQLCQMSVRTQCMNPMMREWRRKAIHLTPNDHSSSRLDVDVEALAKHITDFSLAGIRDVRQRIEKGVGS
jgi:TetR/AcrR family transcriptional regulator, regulator of cefoperazone and chloramphenicol sensitivity